MYMYLLFDYMRWTGLSCARPTDLLFIRLRARGSSYRSVQYVVYTTIHKVGLRDDMAICEVVMGRLGE
jgi:hypothetical protein